MSELPLQSAVEIAAAVAAGRASAREVVTATLTRVEALNPKLGAFTDVLAARALQRADALDATRARGEALGPLAGVPFAVKNLFDIAGLPTRAGSKINRDRAPATEDATLIERLEDAGAILVGALNMGEYAYDFTGENAHYGPSHNPHDLSCMTGGSSGGSGAAVGGGLVPLALGSDTNGSIRVPSSLCGVFGLKPTYGRLSRAKTFPFVDSFDHLGPFARSVADLAASYDAMQGRDRADPAQSFRPRQPTFDGLDRSLKGLGIARLGGEGLGDDAGLGMGFEIGRPDDQPAIGTTGLQVDARDQALAHEKRQDIAAPTPLCLRHEDLDPVFEVEQPGRSGAKPDDRVEGRQQAGGVDPLG